MEPTPGPGGKMLLRLHFPLTQQSPLLSRLMGPPQTLSPYTGQFPVDHSCNCPFSLYIYWVIPSLNRRGVCFVHSTDSSTVQGAEKERDRYTGRGSLLTGL